MSDFPMPDGKLTMLSRKKATGETVLKIANRLSSESKRRSDTKIL